MVLKYILGGRGGIKFFSSVIHFIFDIKSDPICYFMTKTKTNKNGLLVHDQIQAICFFHDDIQICFSLQTIKASLGVVGN